MKRSLSLQLNILCHGGLYNRQELLEMAIERYDTCMPLSVIFFDNLCNEMKTVTNYNDWLLQMLQQNKFESGAIELKVDK